MNENNAQALGKVAGYTAEEVAALQARYGEEPGEEPAQGTAIPGLKHRICAAIEPIKTAWQERATAGDALYAAHHAEFLPAALEIQQTPPNKTARRIGQSIILLFIIGILWATIGKVDVMAVAEGKIIPSSYSKHIQPLDKGVISHIYVREGQVVKKGEKLVALDKTLTAADQNRLTNTMNASQLDQQRLNQFIQLLEGKSKTLSLPVKKNGNNNSEALFNQNQLLQQQWQQYQAQRGSLDSSKNAKQAELETVEAQIEQLRQTLPIVTQRAANYEKLLSTNMVAKDEYLKIEQERIEQQQTQQALYAQKRQLQASLQEIDKNSSALKAETLAMAYQQLAETSEHIKALQEELAKATDTNAKQILYAPVDGVVQEMKINTIGGVVLEAEDLMTIVPSNEVLEVQAFIDNKDIGFIAPGMPAEIKVQTFPFTQYGVINATVKTVTDDALANQEKGLFFAMQLVMEKNTIMVNGKPIALRPGMQVTAEVKTGKRRIIEYLLTPVMKGFKESVRER